MTIPQNKKTAVVVIIILAVTALGVGAFFVINQESANTMHVVGSEDGSATLTIPDSALPEGLSSSDISMKKLTLEEYPNTVAELSPLAVYRLEPDGALFESLVEFSVTLDEDESGFFPFALSLSEGRTEPVDTLAVNERKDGTFVLSGGIRHFSYIVILGGFFGMYMPDDLGTHAVGEPFTVPVIVGKRSGYVSPSFSRPGETINVVQTLDGYPRIHSGHFITKYPIDPRIITDVPGESTMRDNEVSFEGTFTCLDDTPRMADQIEYSMLLFYGYSWYIDYVSSGEKSNIATSPQYNSVTLRKTATVECVYPPGQAPPKSEGGTFIIPSGGHLDQSLPLTLPDGDSAQPPPTSESSPRSIGISPKVSSDLFTPCEKGCYAWLERVQDDCRSRDFAQERRNTGIETWPSIPKDVSDCMEKAGATTQSCLDQCREKTPPTSLPAVVGTPVVIPGPTIHIDPSIGLGVPVVPAPTIPSAPVPDAVRTPMPDPTPAPDPAPQPRDGGICCFNAKAPVGERYYIPFDGSGCLDGDQQVPLDKDCGNPLLY